MSDQSTGASAPAVSSTPAAAPTTNTTSNTQASQGQPQGQPNTQAQAAAVAEAKKWVLKDGDYTKEITDIEELVKHAQKGLGAERKFQVSAQIQKEAKALLDGLREDPISVYEQLGMESTKLLEKALSSGKVTPDILKLAQEVMSKQLQQEAKTPEQLAIEERDAKIAEYEKERQDNRTKAEKQAYEAEVQKMDAELQTGIKDAFEGAKVPMTPRLLRDVAYIMSDYLAKGQMLPPAKALELATKRMTSEFNQIPDEVLENYIGREKVKALIKRELERVKSSRATSTKTVDTGGKATAAPTSEKRPDISTASMKRPF